MKKLSAIPLKYEITIILVVKIMAVLLLKNIYFSEAKEVPPPWATTTSDEQTVRSNHD